MYSEHYLKFVKDKLSFKKDKITLYTSTQVDFTNELIKHIVDSPILLKGMIEIGSKKMPFLEIYDYFKRNKEEYLELLQQNKEKNNMSTRDIELKTEKSLDDSTLIKEKEKTKTTNSFNTVADAAVFKIFSDFFNFVRQNVIAKKTFEITDVHFIISNRTSEYINMGDRLMSTNVLFKYKKIDFLFNFNCYRASGEIHYEINLQPDYPIAENVAEIYIKLLGYAIRMSNLKGNYFKFDDESMTWRILELEKRTYDDIFLPDSQLDDIKLFVNIFKKTGKMLRYLFSGNPGTCKTESTLVIANELKAEGVTIIKMNPTDYLLDKIKLAELLAPSLIIFDDIDLNLGSRHNGSYSRNLKHFLDIFDGTEKLKDNVGVIATSNSIDLLDLAARRPGRFDRILSFDELTMENIRMIILKSLKYNFNTSEDIEVYTEKDILEILFREKVTGAHVYNTIKSLKLRSDINDIKITKEWLLEEVKKDISTINTIKKISKDRLGTKSSIGYQFDDLEVEKTGIAYIQDEPADCCEGEN